MATKKETEAKQPPADQGTPAEVIHAARRERETTERDLRNTDRHGRPLRDDDKS